ncbi:hypothetical protein CPC08DRAFT_771686 [Agrocybe pediades]|nr:hypothetical protein CPC08DRAFT_771686 [Agrocybe pediades]
MRDIIAPLLKKVRIDALGQRELFMPSQTWVRECESIAKAFVHLSRTSSLITHMELCGIDLPSSGEFTAHSLLGGAFPMLEHLTLNDANIDDSAFAEYSSGLPNLRYLKIVASPGIGGDGFLSFMANRRDTFQLVL